MGVSEKSKTAEKGQKTGKTGSDGHEWATVDKVGKVGKVGKGGLGGQSDLRWASAKWALLMLVCQLANQLSKFRSRTIRRMIGC